MKTGNSFYMMIRSLIRKEFIQIKRTPAMLAISLGVPIIQLLILGYAISGDVIHVPAVIVDLDNTEMSRHLVSKMENTPYMDIRFRSKRVDEIETILERNDAILGIVIALASVITYLISKVL